MSSIKNYSYYIYLSIPVVIVLNILNNILNNNFKINFNVLDAVGAFLIFIFLWLVGINLSEILKINNISVSITIYLISFFIIENLIYFFSNSISFKQNFLFVNLGWLLFFLFKKVKFKKILLILLNFQFNKLFTEQFYKSLSKNINLIGDVEEYFFSHSKNIYEYNYYYSVLNSEIPGYPQFSNYLQNVLQSFILNTQDYTYLLSSTLVILFLIILFIYELKISVNLKALIIFFFTLLILNSSFLQFLFTHSLMSEGILGWLAAVVIFNISKFDINNNDLNIWLFFILGTLYFSKQFLSSIILIVTTFFILSKKRRFFMVMGYFGLAFKLISHKLVFYGLSSSHHLNQIDVIDTIKNIIFLRDLNFINFNLILNNLFKDIPTSLMIIAIMMSSIQLLLSKKTHNNFVASIILCNFLLIILLYISAWRNMELESPIRFIYLYLPLKISLFADNLTTLKQINVKK